MTVDLHDEALLIELDRAAKSVASDYGKYLPENDLYQEAWEWMLRHPLLTEKLQAEGKLQFQVRDHLRLLAQREKAVRLGYHPDDVEYYTPGMVARLLPESMSILEATAPSGGTTDDTPSGASDPHGQSGFLTSLIDVQNAWINASFRGYERRALTLRYVEDLNWHEVADRLSVELEEAKRTVAQGLRRICDFLGGFRGKSCPVDCPDCTQRLIDNEEGESSEQIP